MTDAQREWHHEAQQYGPDEPPALDEYELPLMDACDCCGFPGAEFHEGECCWLCADYEACAQRHAVQRREMEECVVWDDGDYPW